MKRQLAVTFLVVYLVTSLASIGLANAKSTAEKPNPDQALSMLKEGNSRFVSGKAVHPHADAARLTMAGAKDQADYAYATVIACSDSRVPVELIFDAGVMDIFVVRVAGNVCNTDEIGSIEYGLAHVNTPILVVLGHTKCGAVTAVTNSVQGHGHPMERNIPPLVDSIVPAVRRAMSEHPDVKGTAIVPYAIEANVWQGIEDLFMQSPATRDLVKSGKVKVVGAIYDIGTGKINWLPIETTNKILQKVEASPERAIEPMASSKESEGHQ